MDWKRYQALQGKQSPILPMHYYSEQGPGPRKETLPTDAAKSDINERFTTETGSSRAAGPVVPGDNDRVTQSAALVVGPTHDHDKRELDVGPVTQGEPNGPSEPVSGALPLGIIEREIDSMGLEIPPPENEGSLLEANGSHPPKLDSKEISISNHKKEDSKNVKPIGSPNLNIGDSGEHGKIRKRPETACQSPTAPQEKTGTAITRMASGTSPFSSKFHCKSVTQKSAQVSPAGVVVGANTRSKSPLAKQNRASEGTGAQITPKRAQTIPPETILGRSIIKSAPGPVRDKGISTQQVVRTRDSHHVTEPTFSSGRDESSFSDSDNAISICSTVLPQDSEYNDHVMDGVEDEEGDSFPILYNPVLPQLENRGAVANFLKSKENDKATEWSFWGSTPKPTTQPENSSIGTKSEDSVGTTLDHQIKPKAKQGQEKFQDSTASQSKASLVPMGQREGIGSGPHKQNEEDRPYQHIAVFATEDGRLTPRPPDLEGTRRWGNELGNSWLQGKSKTTPDFMDSSKAPIHLEYPGKERSDPRVPKSFLNRLGELDDHNGRSIDTRTPESSLVGGQLPVALRCPTCCRFHMGDDCGEAPAGCIICGGRHWVKQCDAAAKAIASTFRPGISCNRCGMMHKNMCPSRTACPVCLRIHTGLCLKPSGTCRYCGAQHWENGCPRWVALDEETGFSSVNSHTTRTVKKMSDLVMRRFGCGKYFGSLNNRDGGPNRQYEAPKYPFNPMEIRTIPDMLNYLNDQDARRCLPPTYSNAKAIKRDANSILRGKGGFVFDPTQFDSDGCFSGGERGAKVGSASRLLARLYNMGTDEDILVPPADSK